MVLLGLIMIAWQIMCIVKTFGWWVKRPQRLNIVVWILWILYTIALFGLAMD